MTPGIWHYILELLTYLALAYFVGCLLGAAWRRTMASAPVAMEEALQPAEINTQPPAPEKFVQEPARMSRPKGISGPRNGKPDDLQRISGVGPKNEKVLHSLGFFHFDQIAEWTREQVEWVDDHLNFNGRIGREEWINQCRLLAAGNEQEFTRLYGTGGLKGADGESKSGSRTRRS